MADKAWVFWSTDPVFEPSLYNLFLSIWNPCTHNTNISLYIKPTRADFNNLIHSFKNKLPGLSLHVFSFKEQLTANDWLKKYQEWNRRVHSFLFIIMLTWTSYFTCMNTQTITFLQLAYRYVLTNLLFHLLYIGHIPSKPTFGDFTLTVWPPLITGTYCSDKMIIFLSPIFRPSVWWSYS